jgi:hypothetical protein
MGFSLAQYQAAIDKLEKGMDDILTKTEQTMPAARAAADRWYIPGFVADAIIWCGKKIVELAKWLWNKFVELLKGAAAPIMFFKYAMDWQDIRGDASKVQGTVHWDALKVLRTWEGEAEDDYAKAIRGQSPAAGRIVALADKVSMALAICAAAGLAFYLALAAIAVKFIAAMITAIAAFGTAVFSWAGLALVVEEAGVNATLIWAAVGALSALLGAQAHQMAAVKGEAVDASTFPGGQWPKATIA